MSWKRTIAVLLMSIAIPTSNRAAERSIVVPNALADVEGNSFSIAPFTGLPFSTAPSRRYQQVYHASQFGALAAEGELITALYFRMDTDQGPHFGSLVLLRDVQINLSTTPRAPDNLSTNFAENVGADDTVVYARGELQIDGTYSAGARPQPFGLKIALEKPFPYRRAAGNLLFDLRIFTYSNSFGSISLDYEDVAGDSVSTVYATNVLSTVGIPLTQGLVTRFVTRSSPAVNVVRTNANLELTWVDRPEGFVMETSGNLSPTSSWQQVSAPVITNGATLKINLPLNTNVAGSFYRLKYNPGP